MAPLPQNNTARVIYEYSWPHGDGQFQVRYEENTGSVGAVDSYVLGFLSALDPLLSANWTITGQRFQRAGSSISLPVPPISFTSTAGDTADEAKRPLELSFQGRSEGGRKASLSIYGTRITVPAIYRILYGVLADVDAVLDYLQNNGQPSVPRAIDGEYITWYRYVNLNYNSYYERQARK